MKVIAEERRIVIRNGASRVLIEPWGENSVRVRMTAEAQMDDHDWALCEKVKEITPVITQTTVDMTDPWYRGEEWKKYHYTGTEYTMVIGKLTVKVNAEGWISFYNQKGDLLTQEYWRNRDRICRYAVPIRIPARELKPITGTSDYELTARFEAFDDEKIFGMGQYQEKHMDKKDAVLELAHRNSQASVPFYVSSRGYGFFWNNPAIGRVTFANNLTEWTAECTEHMDLWITAGDTPAEIEEAYANATGKVPMMPDYATGFWQCKLRYTTQEQLLNVAAWSAEDGDADLSWDEMQDDTSNADSAAGSTGTTAWYDNTGTAVSPQWYVLQYGKEDAKDAANRTRTPDHITVVMQDFDHLIQGGGAS